MSEDKVTHQKGQATEVNQSTPAENSPERPPVVPETPKFVRRVWAAWSVNKNKIGALSFMLAGLVLLVAGATYLSSQQAGTNNSNPSTQLIIVQLNDIYRLDAVRAGK